MERDRDAPDTVHHYTTPAGLIGIISNGEIWATDIRFLNDARELKVAIDLVLEEFEQMPLPEPDWVVGPDGKRHEYYDGLTRLIVAEHLNEWQNPFRCYVACFCEDGDLLSQWRGYAAGLGGYSIEFATARLPQLDADVDENTSVLGGLKPVAYGTGAISDELREWIRRVGEERTGHPGTHGWLYTWGILPDLASVKDPAFEEEREWRLVRVDPSGASVQLRFRDGRYGVIPFTAFF